jgi:branched-chain amino acid transport system permease protein
MYSMWTLGYVNAATPTFFGLGAYTVAILTMKANLPFWLAFPIGGIVPATIAVILGFPGLKVTGTYFLILTLAFCEFMGWLFTSWKSLFGGQTGIYPIRQPLIHVFGHTIDFSRSLVPYYYLALILAILAYLVYFRIHRSRLGRVWDNIGTNGDLLANAKISVFTQKQICLAVSCLFAGLAGSIYAPFMTIVTPGQFTFWQGVTVLLGVLVGGTFSPLGAIIGTVFMAVLSVLLQRYSQYQPLIWGPILILTLLFMPSGLIGLPGKIINKIKEVTTTKVAES